MEYYIRNIGENGWIKQDPVQEISIVAEKDGKELGYIDVSVDDEGVIQIICNNYVKLKVISCGG